MAKHRLGILAFLSFTARISAITLDAAPSTTFQVSSTSSSPLTTPPPAYNPSNTPSICGWVDHNFSNSYTCAGNNTCLWNSDLKRVGCGRTDSITNNGAPNSNEDDRFPLPEKDELEPFSGYHGDRGEHFDYFTSCVPNYALQFCDSSCFANPSIVKCGSQIPHCITALIGPMENYSILACGLGWPMSQYTVDLTYSGQTTLEYLPRYLGNDSVITYGTRTPKPVTDPKTPVANNTASTPTATGTNAFGYFVTPLPDHHGNWTMAAWIANYNRAQRRKEIIVGCTIGGFMVLIAGCLGCWLGYAWRKRRRLRAREEEKRGSEVGLRRLERDGTTSRYGENDVITSTDGRESVVMAPVPADGRRHSEARTL